MRAVSRARAFATPRAARAGRDTNRLSRPVRTRGGDDSRRMRRARARSGDDDAMRRAVKDARVERAREGDVEVQEEEDEVAASASDVAFDALSAAVRMPAIEHARAVFRDRGSTELFEPGKSSDLLERFIEREMDEVEVAVSACTVKEAKCSTCKTGYSDVVLLQAFDWLSTKRSLHSDKSYYRRIEDRVPMIADFGFTHVWLPPPSLSVDEHGYMPSEIYNLDGSEYGDEAELKSLVQALKKAGIAAVCDIVINHRCAEYASDGRFISFADEVTPSGRRINWGAYAIVGDDPFFREGQGANDSGDSIEIAPDLDHTNAEIREAIIEWLNWLKDDIGFSGWRFDFVQGYAPNFVREYVEKTVGFEQFCVGENWVGMTWSGSFLEYNQDKPRRVLVDWLNAADECAALFDFVTKGILQEAVKRVEFWRLRDQQGGMPGLAGWVPQSAVTFLDNHDTGYPQNHWPFPLDRLGLGYAYTLLHPGIPCVFGPHIWCCDENLGWSQSLTSEIRALLSCRKLANVCCESRVDIKIAESDLYVAFIDDKLIVKLGPRYDVPGEILAQIAEFELATHGDDYAVWIRKELLEQPFEE